MIAYIDSSVLIRILLKAANQLPEWGDLTGGITSELLNVECHRTLDQLWHRRELTDEDLAEKRPRLLTFLQRLDVQRLDRDVLDLASQPLPTSLATLDAIHLATAQIYRAGQPENERPILFATHDRQLAKAAAALHFEVIGIERISAAAARTPARRCSGPRSGRGTPRPPARRGDWRSAGRRRACSGR